MPGYILKTSGDTLRAEILDTDRTDFESVTYRMSSTGEEIRLTPGEANGYGINGGRKFLSIASTALERESRFYEVLVSGKAKLYLMDSRFMIKVNDTYYELKNGSREEMKDGRVFVRETYPFRGILNFLFQDCKAVRNDIKVVILSEPVLVKTVSKYNDCFGGSAQLDNQLENRVGFALYAGLANQQFSFVNIAGGGGLQWLVGSNPTSNSVAFGASGKYSLSTRWWVSLGGTYFNSNLDFSSVYASGAEKTSSQMKYQSSNFNIEARIHYSLRTYGIIPYFFAGPMGGFTFSESSERTSVTQITLGQGTTIVQSPVHYDDLFRSDLSFGVTGGIGARLKSKSKWTPFIETRFSFQNGGIKDYPAFNVGRTGIGLMVGVSLN